MSWHFINSFFPRRHTEWLCLATNFKMFSLSRFGFLLKTQQCPHLKGCSSQTLCKSSSSEDFPICADPSEAVRLPYAVGISLHCLIGIHFWPPGTQCLQRIISEEKNLFVTEHNHLSLPQKPLSISRSYQVNTATGGVTEVSSEWLTRRSNNDTAQPSEQGLRHLQVLKADVTRQTDRD